MISLGGMFRDPDGDVSSTRVMATVCVVVGCVVALLGMALNREQAATVAALLGGGAGTFFARAKSQP